MMRTLWRLRLALILIRWKWATGFRDAYAWSSDGSWDDYYENEYTPLEAMLEDASYGC